MWNLKTKRRNKRETIYRCRGQTDGCQRGGEWEQWEKKKGDCEAMNANPLACGDHFKTYIYMKPSHAYLDHIQLLSIIPQQN